jgi:hypothetical protein
MLESLVSKGPVADRMCLGYPAVVKTTVGLITIADASPKIILKRGRNAKSRRGGNRLCDE